MSVRARDDKNNLHVTGAVAGPTASTDSPEMGNEEDTSIEYLLEPGGGGGPPPNGSNDGKLEIFDEHLESAIDTASDMFGVDYNEVFDTAGYRSLDDRGEGVLGLTEYEVNGLDKYQGNAAWIDDNTALSIDESLKHVDEHDIFSMEDLYHVLGHEGVHGEFFNGSYGTSMREQGTPITTLMALSRKLQDGDESDIEGATEYSARLRNPNYTDVKITAYEGEVDNIDEYLTDVNANVSMEEESMIQSPASIGGLTINYADSDGESYIEHGEIETEDGGKEYILALGDSEKAEAYIDENDEYAEVFRGETPLQEDGTYDTPFLEDFESYLEESIDENYSESQLSEEDDYESKDFLSYLGMVENDQEYSLRQSPQSQWQITERVVGRDPGDEPTRRMYDDDDIMDFYDDEEDFRA